MWGIYNSKTAAKMAVARIKLLRNKREVVVKQMRRDIALLLQSGQDATARIRVIFRLNFYFEGCRLTFVDNCVLGFSHWSWDMLESWFVIKFTISYQLKLWEKR